MTKENKALITVARGGFIVFIGTLVGYSLEFVYRFVIAG